MKNINNLYENKKSKSSLENTLKRNFVLATKDQEFIRLCNKLNLSEKVLMKYTSKLENSVSELNNCKGCKGLENCKNPVMGYINFPKVINSENVEFDYVACKYKQKEVRENPAFAQYFEMPAFLRKAKLSDLFIDDKNRVKLIKYVNDFLKKYKAKNKMKGLYLHGSFGSGKSYIISAMINELAFSGVKGVVVYYPTLLRKLKESFNDNTNTYLMRELMNADILLIDDIGAESNTAWSRDEILGTILQHRMDNELSTFFTSNLNIEELEEHLSTTRERNDKVKAKRIIERIKQLTIDMELISENRRN